MNKTDQTELTERDDRFTTTGEWSPESPEVQMEIGIAGICNHCDTELIAVPGSDTRLQCPDCGYLAGVTAIYPDLRDGGEPGTHSEWPSIKSDWDIDDGRATFERGLRGTHSDCGTFVENDAEAAFGSPPDLACSGCGGQFGAMYQMNTLVDPVNDINHLEGE